MGQVKQATCEERIQGHMESRIETIRRLWEAYKDGEEDREEEGPIHEYGLSFDYVPADTFADQEEGYWRWQLSWGGPSDEFRFYADPQWRLRGIEYRFHDWFDGAGRDLEGDDKALLRELWDWFEECGSVKAEFDKATQE